MTITRRRPARPLPRAVAAVALLALLLVACGPPAANEVDMGVASFDQSQVTVSAGQPVHFVDSPTGGGVHVLCVGSGLTCVPQPGAPAALDTTSGLTFNQGDSRDITFPTRGTFDIICTIHPGMEVVIQVQ